MYHLCVFSTRGSSTAGAGASKKDWVDYHERHNSTGRVHGRMGSWGREDPLGHVGYLCGIRQGLCGLKE
jgi:hypothetical protein